MILRTWSLTVLAAVALAIACLVGAAVNPQPVSACWSTAEFTCPKGTP